ncbi:hypothetical protein M422DRAFT_250242 [Sphaerobolus stellatus SS14]|uniref:Unplaced genomic scaffold SPHSTscaffold_33, whole genome shotgun sequence n=1 Tax=Sphaerobolus stellatus (strain SS14) TaxID=990650 RepID=A0A0C9UTN0_SPHS4|nr:hypothetical protein M422DRAFT_250242 [Sphaerobolus stellatus SS14]
MAKFSTLLALSVLAIQAVAFPQHQPLAGLTERELEDLLPRFKPVVPPPPPGPPKDTSVKLVNDKDHPYEPLRKGDIRGPCPGLNTLASHGYLPRNGVVTPAQIINAVQDGFGMDNELAILLAYSTMLTDGNVVTNLMSIGQKTPLTGPDPPAPAIVGGLNTHGTFEGDAGLTRADFFFGDNHSFNQTLFNEFVEFSNKFGGGVYNQTVAAEYRFFRIQQSTAENPTFTFVTPRFVTAYRESVFPFIFFVDGRKADGQLSMKDAFGFFNESRMPDGFHRADGSKTADLVGNASDAIFAAHPVQPGANAGKVNTYTPDPNSPTDDCGLYETFVNLMVKQYPNPQGVLRTNLNLNLGFFFQGFPGCTQLFPFGQ